MSARFSFKRKSAKTLIEIFNDSYYDIDTLWWCYNGERIDLITIVDYKEAVEKIGKKNLKHLRHRCPRAILLPIITLLCKLPSDYDRNCEFGFRNEDEAVCVSSGTSIYYLIPSSYAIGTELTHYAKIVNFYNQNLKGFEDVTR